MYWHKLDEQDKLMLATHIYRAAMRVLREDGGREVWRDALLRAGARAGEDEQLAQRTHEAQLQGAQDREAGKGTRR